MSLIVAVYVEEGIVLASDSRLSYNQTLNENGATMNNYNVHNTDTAYKTFLCPNNIGISSCGNASINGKPIAGFIEEFIRINIKDDTDIDDVPTLIRKYFSQYNPIPNTNFIVAGYHNNINDNKLDQRIWIVSLLLHDINIDTSSQGAQWAGETDILSRMFTELYIENSGNYIPHEFHEIPWNLYGLQDAVDFARFAIKITIDSMRFQLRPKTVGGDIDILVLKQNTSFWISKKELS